MKIFPKALKISLAKPHTFVLCYFTTVQYCMERNGTVMLKIIDDFVWGVPLIVLILAVGIFLTIRLRGLQITKLPLAVRHIIANEKDGRDGEVSSFGALCTALSATIGTGNIVGVATAVVAGGPGALFWMWIAALFGTATKYAECLLAIKYRVVEADGHVVGGPFYYIENGMGRKFRWLGQIFAFFGVGVGLLGIGTFTQINGITGAVKGFFDPETACSVQLFGNTYSWSVVISGLILTVCVALVIIGGIKRISSVAQVVVPFMALVYVVTVLIILLTHLGEIPAALATIVQSAFGLRAAAGGTLGAILVAMQKGIARGIFSNEAGLGSAPIAAATAKTDEPVAQGLVSMMGTVIDTLIICTMTGLSIIITDTWNIGLDGVDVTPRAFQIGLPFPERGFAQSTRVQVAACDMSYEGIVEADPTKPYEAMARRLVYSPFNGPAQRRIDRALEMAKTVGADGAVWFCHWGCKHTLGGARLGKKALEEAGLPTLLLDGDSCDRGFGGEGQAATRMEAFLEVLEGMA